MIPSSSFVMVKLNPPNQLPGQHRDERQDQDWNMERISKPSRPIQQEQHEAERKQARMDDSRPLARWARMEDATIGSWA